MSKPPVNSAPPADLINQPRLASHERRSGRSETWSTLPSASKPEGFARPSWQSAFSTSTASSNLEKREKATDLAEVDTNTIRTWVTGSNANDADFRGVVVRRILRFLLCLNVIVFAISPWKWAGGYHGEAGEVILFVSWLIALILESLVLDFCAQKGRHSKSITITMLTLWAWTAAFLVMHSLPNCLTFHNETWHQHVEDSRICHVTQAVVVYPFYALSHYMQHLVLRDRVKILSGILAWPSISFLEGLAWILHSVVLLPSIVLPVVAVSVSSDDLRRTFFDAALYAVIPPSACYLFACTASLPLFAVPAWQLYHKRAQGEHVYNMQNTPSLAAGTSSLRQFVALVLSVIMVTAEIIGIFLDPWGAITDITFLLDTYVNIMLLIVLSGACLWKSKIDRAATKSEQIRMKKQAWRRKAYKRNGSKQWQKVLEDLAGRGVTLENLLEFWVDLPKVMPNYDDSVHTTSDVVWQVIVPQSEKDGCSWAEHLGRETTTKPTRMVTHNWSNLFRDLIAAIVADALQQTTYDSIAILLTRDVPLLKKLLNTESLQMSYWVCAFAVNQHQSICEMQTYSGDPKTAMVPQKCRCGVQKFFNETPPLRCDGKSINCQMNKFDDMIAYLAASVPGFEQVVAVDREFNVFDRAWCVAEMVEANKMGIPQALKCSARSAVSLNITKLKTLDVQEMQAARAADVVEILAKIPNIANFNAFLQDMLFGSAGIVGMWAYAGHREQACSIGRATVLAQVLNIYPSAQRRRSIVADDEKVRVSDVMRIRDSLKEECLFDSGSRVHTASPRNSENPISEDHEDDEVTHETRVSIEAVTQTITHSFQERHPVVSL